MKRFIALLAASLSLLITPAFAEDEAKTEETVVASGQWVKKTQRAAGDWSIVERDGGTYIVLDEAFKTRSAPDLKLFLSPLPAETVKNKTAVEGSVLIAPLTSAKGAQEYRIPADVDLSDYQSVLIHCEAYTKLWAAGDLS